MIWAQIKGYVRSLNMPSKTLDDVLLLTKQGIAGITPDAWANCVDHVIKVSLRILTYHFSLFKQSFSTSI